MRTKCLLIALVTLVLFVAACLPSRSGGSSRPASTQLPSSESTEPPSSHAEWLSAKEAVQQAYAALKADWKAKAKLVLVARYSQYAGESCSPFIAEDDKGFSSDGRLEHWAVIFVAPPEASQVATVFCVRAGVGATLLNSHLMAFSGLNSFDLEGWVDSTELQFRHKPLDLALRTNEDLATVDAELAKYPVLWIAYTSAAHYDVYDASNGQFVKTR